MSRLDQFGAQITRIVGTMPCAIIFLVISMVSLPAALASDDAFVIVSWLSQSFLQLVLLPIIMVGQRVLTQHVHENTAITSENQDHHERQHEKLDEIIAALNQLRDA